jgi:hypothetical protein
MPVFSFPAAPSSSAPEVSAACASREAETTKKTLFCIEKIKYEPIVRLA